MPMVGPGGTVGLKMPGGMSTLGIEPLTGVSGMMFFVQLTPEHLTRVD